MDQIRRVVDRATFGWTPATDLHARELGWEAWLDEQLDPDSIVDTKVDGLLADFPTLTASDYTNHPQNNTTGHRRAWREVKHATLLRAVHSRRQLQEVMVDFWNNHFNVYVEGEFFLRHLKVSNDREVARAHTFGRFRDMLLASARNTAMLIYLDNWRSVADNSVPPDQDCGVNENYGRELLELHTLGIINGEAVYTEADVVAAAKVLSGWTLNPPPEPLGIRAAWRFSFDMARHWTGPAALLGGDANGGWETAGHPDSSAKSQEDGEEMLVFLARHPSTARHLAYKLCQRFIADSPPPALVDHLAQVYLQNNTAIAPVLRALFHSAEMADVDQHPPRMRRGFEAVSFMLRSTSAEMDTYFDSPAVGALHYLYPGYLKGMGQGLFNHPSPDGYPEATAEWLSSGAVLNRWRFAGLLAGNTLLESYYPGKDGISVDAPAIAAVGSLTTAGALVDRVASRLLGPATPVPHAGFSDVSTSHPFAIDVAWMLDAGITRGYANGTYRPGNPVTRAAMSAFLYRLAGEPEFPDPASPTFPDVAAGSTFFTEIEWMAAEGITGGFSDGTFRPNAPVSRAAMSHFLRELAGGPFTPPSTPTFSDVRRSDQFFADIEWMAAAGVSTGFGDGSFRPSARVSRAAMSAFMRRFAPPPPSVLPPEEREPIVAFLGGEGAPVSLADVQQVRADLIALVLCTPTAMRR